MVIGHQKITEFLNKSIRNNRLAHAYLFIGSEHLGKRSVALEFIKALQCQGKLTVNRKQLTGCNECNACHEIHKGNHPDVLIIEPETIEEKGKRKEREIGIEKIREIQRQAGLFAFRGPYKIIIIDQAEKMTRQAANALLKILEEPTPKTIFILISSAPQSLLPTIISRCLAIKFFSVGNKEIIKQLSSKYPQKNIEHSVKISAGKPGLAVNYLENPETAEAQKKIIQDLTNLLGKDINSKFKYVETMSKDSALAQAALSAWLVFFRDILLVKSGCSELAVSARESGVAEKISVNKIKNIIKKIISAKQILANPSFNARLALEVLMLNM